MTKKWIFEIICSFYENRAESSKPNAQSFSVAFIGFLLSALGF